MAYRRKKFPLLIDYPTEVDALFNVRKWLVVNRMSLNVNKSSCIVT